MTNSIIEKTINFYADSGWKSWFSKVRFWDAPYLKVEKLVPKSGQILDLGCGEGIFTNFIALSSPKRKIVAIELDKNRIKQADHGLKNVKFRQGNAITAKLPKADCIILFHLLHHLPSLRAQEKVIKNCIKALNKKGKLIIVEVNIKPSFKYAVSWFTDHFLVPWLFEKRFYSEIYFRKLDEWRNLLTSYGLKIKSYSAERGKPFTHVIMVCQK